MSFYQALQLDPSSLYKYRKNAENKKEKNFYLSALLVRDVLLVLFSIIFISLLTTLFSSQNSSMAVVLFCILLSIRFVDFGYHIKDSILSLVIILSLLLISPLLMQKVSLLGGVVINFISLFTILVLSCENPEMGNGGLYLFGYVFLSGTQINFSTFVLRFYMTLVGLIILGLILYIKHKEKNSETTLIHLLKHFSLADHKYQWQLQATCGMTLFFLFARIISLERFMWAGFACSSMLTCYPLKMRHRIFQRLSGICIGSILFLVIVQILPTTIISYFGIIAGLCLGLVSSYHHKTIFNCFGALLTASSLYGVQSAVYLRIFNNFMGLLFAVIFILIFQFIIKQNKLNIKKINS
ncbi:MAG: FUSC family protein [Erysipelotrichaceae bacterium]|nr:FUSC family protein [Erysipelotrichaceae bacterium]